MTRTTLSTTTTTTTTATTTRRTALTAAAAILVGAIDAASAGSTQTTTTTIISYDFPAVRGDDAFPHAFCVLGAETATVRSTMPSGFSYRALATPFRSNTKLFGDHENLTPARGSIRDRKQCKEGTYLQPSHEHYKNNNNKNNNKKGFSYEGARFGLDIGLAPGKESATICAMVRPELSGGWDKDLRQRGFLPGLFQDSGGMVWEVYCKENVSATEASSTAPSIPFPSATTTERETKAPKTSTSSIEEQKMLRKQRIRKRNGLPPAATTTPNETEQPKTKPEPEPRVVTTTRATTPTTTAETPKTSSTTKTTTTPAKEAQQVVATTTTTTTTTSTTNTATKTTPRTTTTTTPGTVRKRTAQTTTHEQVPRLRTRNGLPLKRISVVAEPLIKSIDRAPPVTHNEDDDNDRVVLGKPVSTEKERLRRSFLF